MLAKAVVSSEGLTRGDGESASNPAHAVMACFFSSSTLELFHQVTSQHGSQLPPGQVIQERIRENTQDRRDIPSNLISEAAFHHLGRILLVGSKSVGPAHIQGESWQKGMNTGRWGITEGHLGGCLPISTYHGLPNAHSGIWNRIFWLKKNDISASKYLNALAK